MIPVQVKEKSNVQLKRFNRRGSSSKEEVFSTSFAVAPYTISISKKWQSRAWDTSSEIPPRKTVSRRSHLKFSKTGECWL
jgi:hypothetical protein